MEDGGGLFLSLNFLKLFLYRDDMYIYTYIKYISAHQFCYGFNIGDKLET